MDVSGILFGTEVLPVSVVDVSGVLSGTEVLPVSVVWMLVESCPELRYRQNEGKSVIQIFIPQYRMLAVFKHYLFHVIFQQP